MVIQLKIVFLAHGVLTKLSLVYVLHKFKKKNLQADNLLQNIGQLLSLLYGHILPSGKIILYIILYRIFFSQIMLFILLYV